MTTAAPQAWTALTARLIRTIDGVTAETILCYRVATLQSR